MILKHLDLENVRPFKKFLCDFSDKINLIYGNNGIGKTTILEAVYVLSLSKSFRPGMRGNIVKQGEDGCAIQARLLDESGRDRKFAFYKYKDERRIKIDEAELRSLNELVGEFPVVVMSPEDEDIISGSAQARRNYLNRIFSIVDREYLDLLKAFERIRKQRNALLSSGQFEQADLWSVPLAEKGCKIWKKRNDLVQALKTIFDRIWKEIFPELTAKIQYRESKALTTDDFISALSRYRDVERKRKTTQFGPHRDDLEFILENKNLKHFGSQGEKKIFLASLKKAEALFIQDHLNKKPVIMLDDLFAKLDHRRSLKIIDLFKDDFQTLITTTDQNVQGLFEETGDTIKIIRIDEVLQCSAS